MKRKGKRKRKKKKVRGLALGMAKPTSKGNGVVQPPSNRS
jgi:hypothetical protein